jgi:hypothetical protein
MSVLLLSFGLRPTHDEKKTAPVTFSVCSGAGLGVCQSNGIIHSNSVIAINVSEFNRQRDCGHRFAH